MVQLDQSCHLVRPDHEWRDEHCQLSALTCEMILDPRRYFRKGLAFDKATMLQVLENIGKRLGAYPIEVLDELVEAQSTLVSELSEDAQSPLLSDDVDQTLAGTGTDATGFSLLLSNHSVTQLLVGYFLG